MKASVAIQYILFVDLLREDLSVCVELEWSVIDSGDTVTTQRNTESKK